jgi:hypothetical protein
MSPETLLRAVRAHFEERVSYGVVLGEIREIAPGIMVAEEVDGPFWCYFCPNRESMLHCRLPDNTTTWDEVTEAVRRSRIEDRFDHEIKWHEKPQPITSAE